MKRLIGSIVTAAAITSGAFAATEISTNLTGDFLIAPNFFTTGGWETNLKLVNTDTDSSILVRAVIRDYICSFEFDFPILLSPGDVWTATLYSKDGAAYIESSDDSNYFISTNTYASADSYFDKGFNITSHNTNARGKFAMGYVEFYPIAQFDEVASVLKGAGNKIPKSELITRFKTLESGKTTDEFFKYSATLDVTKTLSPTVSPVGDSLTGTVTLTQEAGNLSMTIPMFALKDAGISDGVASGSTITPSQDTVPAKFLNDADIYSVLRTSSLVVPFDNATGDNQVLLSFWNDHGCVKNAATGTWTEQSRKFTGIELRDNQESLYIVGGDMPSGKATSSVAYPYESLVLPVSKIISDAYGVTTSPYTSGWLNLGGLVNNVTAQPQGVGASPSTIATYMNAVEVTTGKYSTNWIYLPTK